MCQRDLAVFTRWNLGAEFGLRALTEHLKIQANLRNWSRREELNLQPTHYECAALPLSYAGS